jgi:hypothetical protein
MDLIEIQTWLLGIFAGGLTANTVISGINLFKGVFTGKKLEKVTKFVAVADDNIKNNQTSFAEVKKQLVKEIKDEIVAPILANLKEITSDNAVLAEISIACLSMVNVPLDQKKQLFNVLSRVSNVSSQAKELLSANIKDQESKLLNSQANDNLLLDNISKS